jgi:hypothetical protein
MRREQITELLRRFEASGHVEQSVEHWFAREL